MTRAMKGAARRQAKSRWFKLAKGKRGARSRCWRSVKVAVVRAGVFATRDRKLVKRDYRRLWITRITAAVRMREFNYSRFIAGLTTANIALNRKMLSEVAIHDPRAFDQIVDQAKKALQERTKAAA